MGIDLCNATERDFYRHLFKQTERDYDIKPLYTYLCPVIIFICFFSIIFNAILMSISRQSKVVNKSPILLLSLNLAVTDLIASLANGLGILINSYLPEVYNITIPQCYLLMFEIVRYAALIASALHLLALAFVHYRGIVNPLHYRSTIFFSQHLSRTINIISIVCWIIPLSILILWFSSSPCQGFQSEGCDYLFLLEFTFRYTVLTLFALPLILMSVIYLRIFIIISRHQKSKRLNHKRSTLSRGVISATGPTCAPATAVNLPELMESRNDNSNVVVSIAAGEIGITRCAYCLARALQDANAHEDGANVDDDDQATVAILGNDDKLLLADSNNTSINAGSGNKKPITIDGRTIESDEESQHCSHRTWRPQHKIDQSHVNTDISTPPEAKRNIITAKGSSVSNWSQSSISRGSSSGPLQKSNSTSGTQTTKEENSNNNSSSSSSSGSRSGDGSSSTSSSDEDSNDSKSSSSIDNAEGEDGLSGLLVSEINANSRRQSDKHVLSRSPGSHTKKKKGFVMARVDDDDTNNNHQGTFLGTNKRQRIASAIGSSTILLENQHSSAQQNIIATNKSKTTISPFDDCDIDNGKNQQQPQQQCTDKSALLDVVSSNPRITQQQPSFGKSLLSRLNPENLMKNEGTAENRLKESKKEEENDGSGGGGGGKGGGGESSASITTDATTATTVKSLETSTCPTTTTTTTMASAETTRATRRTVSLLDSENQPPNDHDNLMERKASSYKSESGGGAAAQAARPKAALKAQFSLSPQQQQVSNKEVRLLTLPASSRDMGANQINTIGRPASRRAVGQKSLDLQQRRAEIQTLTSDSAAATSAGRFYMQQQKGIAVSSDNSPTWECTCDNKLRQLNAKLSRSNTIGDTSGNSHATGSATNRTILSISTSQRSSISSSSVARQSLKSQQLHRSPTIVSGDQQADFRSTSTLGTNAPTAGAASSASNNFTNSPTNTIKQDQQPASVASSGTANLTAKQAHQPTTAINHNNSSFATTNLTGTPSSTYEPQRRHLHSSAVPQTNTKALVTTLLILGTYFISYVPAIIFQVLTCIDYCPYPLYNISFSRRILLSAITNLLLIVKSIIDPFIYSYRMSEIQVAINRYLSKRRVTKASHAVSMHYTSQRLNTAGGAGGGQTNLTKNASHHQYHQHSHHHHHHHSSRSQQLNKQNQLNNFNIGSAANRTNNSFINMTINDKSSGSATGCETTKLQASDTATS